MKTVSILIITILCLCLPPYMSAQVPGIINYQGRVTVAGTNFTGTGQFKFALVGVTNATSQATGTAAVINGFIVSIPVTYGGAGYTNAPSVTITDPTGSGAVATALIGSGTVTNITVQSAGAGYSATPTVTIAAPPSSPMYVSFWSNNGSSIGGSQPTAAVSLSVTKGLYAVLLGDATLANMVTIPVMVFTNADVRLRVWFNDGVSGFQQLSPDQRLAAVGYALMAGNVADGVITSVKLATGAVTSTKIASGAVGATQLASNAVTSTSIAAGAIGSAQLAGGAVTADKIATGAILSTSQLSNPYQSGRTNTTGITLSNFSPYLDVVIPFTTNFSAAPILTTTLAPETGVETYLYAAQVQNSSVSNFTMRLPTSFLPVTLTSNSEDWITAVIDVNGNPAVILYSGSSGFYVRANDHSGSTWANPVEIPGDGAGWGPMQMVNGRPAVAFVGTNAALMFARASDTNGLTWGAATSVTVPGQNTNLWPIALIIANGNPAIVAERLASSITNQESTVVFFRASDVNGTSWGTPITVATNAYAESSIVVNGNPAITFYDWSGSPVKYVRASNASGTTWSTPVTVTAGYGYGSQLAIVNGNPAFVYVDDKRQPSFVRSVDANGAVWGSSVQLHSGATQADSPNLVFANGIPSVSFNLMGDQNQICYVASSDINGSNWNSPFILTGLPFSDGGPSLANVNGSAFIAWTAQGLGLRCSTPNSRDRPRVNWFAVMP